MRRPAIWVCLLLLVPLAIWAFSAATRPPRNDTLRWPRYRNGSEWLVLNIPSGYGHLNRAAEAMNRAFYPDGRRLPEGEVHADLLLSALWPGLVPDNGKSHKEFNQPGGGRLMLALVHSGAVGDVPAGRTDALQEEFDLAVTFSTKYLCVTLMELAEAPKDGKAKCYERTAPDIKSPQYGLDRLGVDFSRYPDIPEVTRAGTFVRDIYYSRAANGALRTVILCTAAEAKTAEDGPQYHTVPQCEHYFISAKLNALVSVAYRRFYLPNWSAIESAWNALLESFIVVPENESSTRREKP